MSGNLWIASYAILSFTVLILTLAMVALYRIVGERPVRNEVKWPFSRVAPGAEAPSALGFGADAGFVLVSTGEADCFAAAMSMVSVATSWGYPVRILVRRSSALRWLEHLPQEVDAFVAEIAPSDFDELGVESVPVTAFVKKNRLIDAGTGLHFPSLVSEHFRLVAGPLGGDHVGVGGKAFALSPAQ